MRLHVSIILFLASLICKKIEAKDVDTLPGTVIIKMGLYNDRISQGWKDAIESRMTKSKLDSFSLLRKTITTEEKAWITLIRSKTTKWNSFRDSLEIPFRDCHVPDTVYVLLGFSGVDDGFTYQYNTVCFDLTALQTNYGAAGLPDNSDRIDRIYAHEFTHLIHKQWVKKNNHVPHSFRDSVLWECLYEGIGMYRSLTKKWMPQNGNLPEITKTALAELYPYFVDHLEKVETNSNLAGDEKDLIIKNLSRGPVNKKWGAFTVAIWLATEANGNDSNLIPWVDRGPDSIFLLAKKYLPGIYKDRIEKAFRNK